ncbi:MAG: glycosyltransferase [Alphaproteobacteria bacterium]|nr:glycosyltransferase [Alphaproteobacteria bacterium]
MTNKTTTPEISVIMPVYNTSLYLRQSIESVINQTFTNWELICINDGSTDNSLEILEEYASKDPRITIIDQENQGLSCARNNGIKKSTGKYIAFIDSDDFYATNFLECLYSQTGLGFDIIGCNFEKMTIKNDKFKNTTAHPIIYKDALKVLLHKNNFIHFNVWNKLYKRSVISDIEFVPHIYYEDWVYNCQVFERANGFVWLKSRLYGYRISGSSIMRSSFNYQKACDYVKGINAVYNYYQEKAPKKWQKVKQTRISRTIKMMMNSALRSKDTELINQTKDLIRQLKTQNLITYKGLSLKNKIKLFTFLNR